uniref:Uncharacterized protein n=1 Tax=Rhizophora mucronata TaxID=61149 RepID=A0A2P2J0V2_RHIMU
MVMPCYQWCSSITLSPSQLPSPSFCSGPWLVDFRFHKHMWMTFEHTAKRIAPFT